MIKFQDIRFKNILSYGNNYTTITFKEGISKYFGENGDGKSTLVEALNFVLFGQPYRKVKKGQLVNSKNKKGLEVYLRFKKQDTDYRIERGIKPDFFRIYEDEVLVPVSSSVKGYQEILIEDILQFDENICNQVTIKSSTKNMAFMTLAKAEKRKIIENILDIEVFSIMTKSLKLKIDAKDIELRSIKKDIDNTTLLIEQEQANLEKLMILQKKMLEEANSNIQVYKEEIQTLSDQNDKYKKGLVIIEKKKVQLIDLNKKITDCKNSTSANINQISKYEAVVEMHNKKIKFLEKTCGDCPKINELMNDEEVLGIDEKIKYVKVVLASDQVTLSELEDTKKKINDILANEKFVSENLARNFIRMKDLETHINKSKDTGLVIDESKLKEYKLTKKNAIIEYNKLFNIKNHLVLLRNLYSDEGIKKSIIRKYLPTINKLLNTYLMKFQADMIFNFDDEFNEVVLTKYKEDFTYYSFSQGQKKRIDLAVMFAFIKFAQLKNKKSDTNLLIMDEVLTSLDQKGTDSVMDVLSDYRDKNNKCIITINHLIDMNQEYFDFNYEVTLDKGFSKIKEVGV